MSKKILLVLVLLAFAGSSFAQLQDDYNHYMVSVDETERSNSVPLPGILSTTKICYGTLNVTHMPSGNHYMLGSANQTSTLDEVGGAYCEAGRSSLGVTNSLSQEIPFGDYASWCISVSGSSDGCAGAYFLHVQRGLPGVGIE